AGRPSMVTPMAGEWDWPNRLMRRLWPKVELMGLSSSLVVFLPETGVGFVHRLGLPDDHRLTAPAGGHGRGVVHAVVAAACYRAAAQCAALDNEGVSLTESRAAQVCYHAADGAETIAFLQPQASGVCEAAFALTESGGEGQH